MAEEDWRTDLVISATADALLSVCALQSESTEPRSAYRRAQRALLSSMERAELAGRPRLRDL